MRESSTYQMILAEGRAEGRLEGALEGMERGMERGIERGIERGMERGMEQGRLLGERAMLLRLGSLRFGTPEPAVQTAIEQLSVQQVEALAERLMHVESWAELLA